MKLSNRSRLRVVLIPAIVSGMLILGQPQEAKANYLAGGVMIAPILLTLAVVCTPVAAVKASDYPGGFSGAVEDCMSLNLKERHPLLTEDNQSGRSAEAEVDESKDRFDD